MFFKIFCIFISYFFFLNDKKWVVRSTVKVFTIWTSNSKLLNGVMRKRSLSFLFYTIWIVSCQLLEKLCNHILLQVALKNSCLYSIELFALCHTFFYYLKKGKAWAHNITFTSYACSNNWYIYVRSFHPFLILHLILWCKVH